MLCECGHEEDRHAGMHDSNAGPCLRCNCSHYEKPTLNSDISPVSEEEFTQYREALVRSLGTDAA